MLINDKEKIWYEKYRPQRVKDLILPERFIKKFTEYLENPTHILLLSVTPGTGKTSLVNAIVKESQRETIFINASKDTSIDIVRGRILQFASTEALDSRSKIVVLDEVDGFAGQAALRGLIEEFSSNCSFILTANYKAKILEPIINRCETYDFDLISNEKEALIPQIYNRLKFILDNEKISYQDTDILTIIKNFYPSIRQMIGELQKSVFENKIVLQLSNNEDFVKLYTFIVKKDYENCIKLIYSLTNPDGFYSWCFNKMKESKVNPKVVLILAKYQYQNAFSRDKNLNLCACVTEIMETI